MKSRLPISKKHIKRVIGEFAPQINRAYAFRRLVEVLKTVEKMRVTNGLVRDPCSGDLVRFVFLGEKWIDQGSQKRKFTCSFPKRNRGATEKPYLRYLTTMLGQIFYQAAGKRPTLGHSDIEHSEFELFVGKFLKHYGISDCRGQIRHYLKIRKTLITQSSTI
jgi:hypothetical protein